MDFWKVIRCIGMYSFLIICSIQDIKEKKLSLKLLANFGVIFFIISFLTDNILPAERVMNMLPGAGVLLIAFLTKEQIGYGDGLCLLVLGNIISYDVVLKAVMRGLILLDIWSIVLLIRRAAVRKTTIPFLPFLSVGMVLQSIIK